MIDRLWRPMTRALLPLLVFVACGGGDVAEPIVAPPEAGGRWTLDDAGFAALPELAMTDGRFLCVADGRTPCPLNQPIANRLDAVRVALWEPGRQVEVWGADSTPVSISAVGQGLGQYQTALAVGPGKNGQVRLIDLTMAGVRMMTYGRDGKFIEQTELPQIRVGEARGFAGKVPLLQGMTAGLDTGTTVFRVMVLNEPTDSTGRLALEVPIPWLALQGDQVVAAPPLFPVAPTYTLLADGEVAWSPGDRFEITRRMADGSPRWELRGDRTRIAITPEEIAEKRAAVTQMMGGQVPESDLDSMQAHSEMVHAAVAGLLSAPDGTIYVAGPATAAPDVSYIRLGPTGQPNGRFTLPKTSRILLAAADSVLVSRRAEGELREIRWVRLTAP